MKSLASNQSNEVAENFLLHFKAIFMYFFSSRFFHGGFLLK